MPSPYRDTPQIANGSSHPEITEIIPEIPSPPEQDLPLTPEQKALLKAIEWDITNKIRYDFYWIFGNPDDKLSGEILAAEIYLWLALISGGVDPEKIPQALQDLKTLHEYWQFAPKPTYEEKTESPQAEEKPEQQERTTSQEEEAKEEREREEEKRKAEEEFIYRLFLVREGLKPEKFPAPWGQKEEQVKKTKENKQLRNQFKKFKKQITGNERSSRIYQQLKKRYPLPKDREIRARYLDAVVEFAHNEFAGISTVTEAQLLLYAIIANNSSFDFAELIYADTPELAEAAQKDSKLALIVEKAATEPLILFYLARIIDYYRLMTYLEVEDEDISRWLSAYNDDTTIKEGLKQGIQEIIARAYTIISGQLPEIQEDLQEFDKNQPIVMAMHHPPFFIGGLKFPIEWNMKKADSDQPIPAFTCMYCAAAVDLTKHIISTLFRNSRSDAWQQFVQDVRNSKKYADEIVNQIMQSLTKTLESPQEEKQPTYPSPPCVEEYFRHFIAANLYAMISIIAEADKGEEWRICEKNPSKITRRAFLYSPDLPFYIQLSALNRGRDKFTWQVDRIRFEWKPPQAQVTEHTKYPLTAYRHRIRRLVAWRIAELRGENDQLLEELVKPNRVMQEIKVSQMPDIPPSFIPLLHEVATSLGMPTEVLALAVDSIASFTIDQIQQASVERLAHALFVANLLDNEMNEGAPEEVNELIEWYKERFPVLESLHDELEDFVHAHISKPSKPVDEKSLAKFTKAIETGLQTFVEKKREDLLSEEFNKTNLLQTILESLKKQGELNLSMIPPLNIALLVYDSDADSAEVKPTTSIAEVIAAEIADELSKRSAPIPGPEELQEEDQTKGERADTKVKPKKKKRKRPKRDRPTGHRRLHRAF